MKTLLHLLLEAAPRHDRQLMTLAVAGSILLVLLAAAAQYIA